MRTLRERVEAGELLLADGATGTQLQARGLRVGAPSEEWNLSHPEEVADLARSYAAAGSDLVYTNTFGGNRIRLRRYDLAHRVAEINRQAVALARQGVAAVGREVFVVASIGPTGELLEPWGDLKAEEALGAFREQVEALAEAGVDGLVLETFSALEEIALALQAAQEVAPHLPLIASMSFEVGGRTMMGVRPEDAAGFLLERGALVVGANCSVGPEVVEEALRAMKAVHPQARLLAKPNAGMPRLVGGRPVYPVSPEEMADFAVRMKEWGVSILGGCCGTTPAHIEAMARRLR